MTVESSLRDELLAAIPTRRAYAISLILDRNRTDHLGHRRWSQSDRLTRGCPSRDAGVVLAG
jgi:hypothetical protein